MPDKSPSVKVVGIFGQLTGSRGDLVISDDVEVPKNAETEGMREKLEARTKEYAAILKPGGDIIWLGTPQTQESIYRKLAEKGYAVRIWTARYPTQARLSFYREHLAPLLLADMERDPSLCVPRGTTLGGASTDTARFSDLDLLERETEYGPAGFLLQFQLDTSLSDGDKYPLKTRDLIVTSVNPRIAPVRLAWASSPDLILKDYANVGFDGDRFFRPMYASPDFADFTGSVMHIDPSGRGKDETGYVVTKFLNGMVFVRRWGGFQDGFCDETLEALATVAAEEEVNLIVAEDNFGDGMFRRLFEPVLARKRVCALEGIKSTGQKEARMISFIEPVLRQHRLVVDEDVIRRDLAHPDPVRRGLYQLTHLTSQRGSLKHDDRLDVLALALQYWSQYLNADTLKAEADYRRKADAAFEREFFAGTIVGAIVSQPKGGMARGRGRPVRR